MKILIDLNDDILKKVDKLSHEKKWYRKNTIENVVEEYFK